MAYPVYTERLLYGEGINETRIYTVPVGKRAVARSIAYSAPAGSGGQIWVNAHGIYAWFSFTPGSGGGSYSELGLVLYAGETLRVDTYTLDIGYMILGHVFDDEIGAPSPPEEGMLSPSSPIDS